MITLQVLVVVTAHWDATAGSLFCFERSSLESPWQQVGRVISVCVGRKGMAWGRGVLEMAEANKREGDHRSPAGVFALGPLFGSASTEEVASYLKMPYFSLEEELEWVDDPSSRYYNLLVKNSAIFDRDWASAEKMLCYESFYRWGIVIQHNRDPVVSGAGSAIFMHITGDLEKGTPGCTAMAEADLKEFLPWLSSEKSPLLIQLPLPVYQEWQEKLSFPSLAFSLADTQEGC